MTTAWLRLEGLAATLASVLLYARLGYGWFPFALLLLVPDLSMLGYLGGPRAGAAIYNLFHTYALPIGLAGASLVADSPASLAAALIWSAHIGIDRMLGYGLKHPTGFRDTHLGRIGRDPDDPAA